MPLKLPASISSEQDLGALVVEIHECIKWLSHESIKKKGGDKEVPSPPHMSEAAAELIHSAGASADKLAELAKELELLQKNAKIITITLAAYPTNTIKQTLVAWCRKEISNEVLVNFNFNKALLGGMVVRAGSRVFDWSFRRQIMNSSDKFIEVYHRIGTATVPEKAPHV
ncbi:MAG: atpH [Candidatus Saccharibacteria bacterium]|nr:atpH [Candidatus Saccharibacteria bacterium]